MDVIAADDPGLRRDISDFYGNDKKMTGEEARKIAERWKEWKRACGLLSSGSDDP